MLRQPSSRAAALAAATAAPGRTMTARRTLASLTSRQSSSAGAAGRQQLWKMSPALTSSLSYRRSVAGLHSSAVQHAEETIKVPQMAESISEGTLKTWLKKEGDYVQADEEIASIETDKIDVAINAPKAGKIGKFLAKEEDTVQVGQDLYTLDSDAEGGESSGSSSEKSESQPSKSSEDSEPSPATDASKAKDMTQGNNKATEAPKEREVNPEPSNEPSEAKSDNSASAPAPSGDAETIKVPQMAESISEGTLKTWMKKVGDFVKADEEIASIETDKIDVTINAPKSGTIVEILAKEDETVSVGQDLYKLAPGDAPSGGSSSSSKPEPTSPENTASGNRKANESRQEITNKENEPKRPEPKASKPEEVKQPKSQPQSSGKDAKKAEEPKAAQAGARNETRVKMNSMRKRIAERLKQSQNAAASLTTFNEIDMSSLMQMRSQYKDQVLKNHGVKLGFMSAFAKASCLALKEIPAANASIEGPGPGDQIVYRDYVDLSVAVATPKGLVTPVVRNAETMNFLEIEQAIAGLGKKARDNKLTLEDMAGGTFTISNGGVFGSLYGTPIINVPQAAVLGMHSIKDRAVVVDGKIEIRPIMVVALTYDHRLLDGREAVTFLVRIKQYIEDPRFMLLA